MAHGDHLKYQAKPKAGRQTLFRLTSYLVCDRLLLSVIGVLIVLSIAANLGGSYLLRPIINRYIIPGDFLGLGKMLGILIGVYLTGVFAVYVEYRLLNKIGQRTVARMREDLFRKMEQLPVGYFDTHQHGDLMSRYTNDMDRISDALTDSLCFDRSGYFLSDVGHQPDLDLGHFGYCPTDVLECPGNCS